MPPFDESCIYSISSLLEFLDLETVRFHYHDPAVRKGLTLTVIGVILIMALLAIPMVLTRLRPGLGTETNGPGPEQVES